MSTVVSIPIVINDVPYTTGRLDLDYNLGVLVIDVDLAHLVGEDVTFRVAGHSTYAGSAIVTEVHIPADGPVVTVLSLHRPIVKELTP